MVTISCGFGAGCIQTLLFVEELPWPKFAHVPSSAILFDSR